jgi:single-stranded-DNA-specific exonuclease
MAEEIINPDSLSIVLNLSDVEGIAGIIASNLSNSYRKPTIIFSQTNDVLIGSGRSTQDVNLLEILKTIESNNDYIVKVGGHAAACGITIKAESFNQFNEDLTALLENITTVDVIVEDEPLQVIADDFITVSDINKTNCEALRPLYFFTEQAPTFILKDITITKVKYSNNNPDNICFTLKDNTGTCDTWTWKIGNMYKQMGEPKQVSLVAELDTKFGKPSLNILSIIPKGDCIYE